MYLNRTFELSMMLDSDQFEEVFSQSYCGEDYLEEDFFQVSKQYKDCEVYLMTYPMHGEFVANVIKRIKDNNPEAKIVIIHQPLEFFDEESKTLMDQYEIQDENIEELKNCQFSWTGYFNFKTSLRLLG